jgi:hypothetical protein
MGGILFVSLPSCTHIRVLQKSTSSPLEELLAILSRLPERDKRFKLLKRSNDSLDLRYNGRTDFAEIHLHLYSLPEGKTLLRIALKRTTIFFPRESFLKEFLGILKDLARDHKVILDPEPSLSGG